MTAPTSGVRGDGVRLEPGSNGRTGPNLLVPRTPTYYPKGYCELTDRAATLDEIREIFHRRTIRFYSDQIDSQELNMGTAEWIALGLLLIALIGWFRWRGTPVI